MPRAIYSITPKSTCWYKAHAENIQFCTGEAADIMPNDSYQLFMAHAWVAGTPAATLERYIDVPWVAIGDDYYLLKLAETIKAYRGITWEIGKAVATDAHFHQY